MYEDADTGCVLSFKEVHDGFLSFCEDADNVKELEDATRDYNSTTGNDVSMFEMFLMWEISACNLREVDA